MASTILLEVNGVNFSGWNRMSVSRSMEQLCGDFSIELIDGGKNSEFGQVKVGDECRIIIKSSSDIRVPEIDILTGHIDEISRVRTGTSTSLSVTGRDITADLVDCAAITPSNSWSDVSLIKIAQDLCKPFDIYVDDFTNPGPKFKKFTLQNGESAFAAIERACRQRGVVPLTDRFGNLLLTYAQDETRPTVAELIEGENIEEIEEIRNNSERFSEYTVRGQNSGNGSRWKGNGVTGLKARATDSGVVRYRPLIILAEGKTSSDKIKQRANWEAQVRAGRSVQHTVKVQDWFLVQQGQASEEQPWSINSLVNLSSDIMGINEKKLVTSVRLDLDNSGGRFTTLGLKDPKTYAADPDGEVKP